MFGVIALLLLFNVYATIQLSNKIDFFDPTTTKTKQMKVVEQGAKDVTIDFYMMSYCPYGNQAEEGLEPVFQAMKNDVTFRPRYVWYENYKGGGPSYCVDEGSQYCSMHGVQEGNQNIRELCVYKYTGADEFFEFALAMNKQCSSSNADTCWEGVADSLGLDTDKIKQCEADESIELAAIDKKDGDVLGVRGSPSVFINNKQYNGQRTPEGYKQAICAEFADPPESCSGVIDVQVAEVAAGACG